MSQVSASGGSYDPNVDPGPVNPPAILEPLATLTGGVPQIWMAASGGPNWGGALVSIAFDSPGFVKYDYVGTITAPALQGIVNAGISYQPDPDTTNTLGIDLTECAGIMPTSATNADADAFRTLAFLSAIFGSCVFTGSISGTTLTVSSVTSGAIATGDYLYGVGVLPGTYVVSGSGLSWQVNQSQATSVLGMAAMGSSATVPANGELLAYGSVASTGTYTSDLTYLRRGLYGSTNRAHSVGEFFSRIDLGEVGTPPNSVLTYNLPPQYIGAPFAVKFQSFNVFGNATEDISTVTEFVYSPTGAGYGGASGVAPTTPTGFVGYARGPGGAGFNVLDWNANPSSDHVQYYAVLRKLHSSGGYTTIGTTSGTEYTDNGAVSGNIYDYELEAVNAAGAGSAAGPVTLTTT